MSRLVEIFSRRLQGNFLYSKIKMFDQIKINFLNLIRSQVQERLTKQIAEALNELLDPLGVYVLMECS